MIRLRMIRCGGRRKLLERRGVVQVRHRRRAAVSLLQKRDAGVRSKNGMNTIIECVVISIVVQARRMHIDARVWEWGIVTECKVKVSTEIKLYKVKGARVKGS